MDNVIRFPLPPDKARDDKRAQVARPYLDHLFAQFALNGNFQWYDGDHEITKCVQFAGADVSLISKYTYMLSYAEVKTDFHMPYNFCLETISNTMVVPPIPGWMATAKADRLVTSFIWLEGVLDVFIHPFQELKAWFWRDNNYLNFRKHTVQGTKNHTESRIVPVTKVIEHVKTYRYLIINDGRIFTVPLRQHPITAAQNVLESNDVPFKRIVSEKAS